MYGKFVDKIFQSHKPQMWQMNHHKESPIDETAFSTRKLLTISLTINKTWLPPTITTVVPTCFTKPTPSDPTDLQTPSQIVNRRVETFFGTLTSCAFCSSALGACKMQCARGGSKLLLEKLGDKLNSAHLIVGVVYKTLLCIRLMTIP